MALWRLNEAAFGQAGPDGQKASKRAMAAGRCVFYGFVAYSVLSYAAGEKGKRARERGQGLPGRHGEGPGLAWRAVDRRTLRVRRWPVLVYGSLSGRSQVIVQPEEATSAIASRLNSSEYRFVQLPHTWRCF